MIWVDMAPDSNRFKQLKSLAEKLGQAWLENSIIEEPNNSEIPQSREEAYFVQDHMAQFISKDISGWKVGATSAKMRELDGHDDVIPGRIFSPVTFVGPIQKLQINQFPNARVETEFAFRLNEDIPIRDQNWTAADLENKVSMYPAVEIIGNRHQLKSATKAEKSLMTIADNGGGIGFVFGSVFDDWRNLNFRNHNITLQVDDNLPAENFLGDMRCQPIEAVADLVNHLSNRDISLRKGDFVSTGAATVPQPIIKGSFVNADFGIIGKIQLTFV